LNSVCSKKGDLNLLHRVLSTFLMTVLMPIYASAGQVYDCKRLNLPTQGFQSASVAESWYPAMLNIWYSDDLSQAWSNYGTFSNRGPNDRKFGKISYTLKGGFHMLLTHDTRNGQAYAALSSPGYRSGQQAGYACGSPKKTNWVPK
jgi:hypothetical protein